MATAKYLWVYGVDEAILDEIWVMFYAVRWNEVLDI